MNMTDYQREAFKFAVYPEKGWGTAISITYCALGLGEAGEFQGKLKKVWRGDQSIADARDSLIDELGDVLWYVAAAANELNISMEDLALKNLEKLKSRQARGVLKGSGDNR